MPDQAIVYMGIVVRHDVDIPTHIVPRPITWTAANGRIVTVTPELKLLEDPEAEIGTEEQTGVKGAKTVYGFPLNGRYFPKIVDVGLNPARSGGPNVETGEGYVLPLPLDKMIDLRAQVRVWWPEADVVVTTVSH